MGLHPCSTLPCKLGALSGEILPAVSPVAASAQPAMQLPVSLGHANVSHMGVWGSRKGTLSLYAVPLSQNNLKLHLEHGL